MVACDQPFEEVDRPEFRAMLSYAHHPAPTLKIPHCDTIKRRIMQMGKDTIESTKAMFKVHGFVNYPCEAQLTWWIRRKSKEKLVSRWTPGPQATIMHSLQLLPITLQNLAVQVRSPINFFGFRRLTIIFFMFRRTAYWFSRAYRWTFWWEYGWGSLGNLEAIWNRKTSTPMF